MTGFCTILSMLFFGLTVEGRCAFANRDSTRPLTPGEPDNTMGDDRSTGLDCTKGEGVLTVRSRAQLRAGVALVIGAAFRGSSMRGSGSGLGARFGTVIVWADCTGASLSGASFSSALTTSRPFDVNPARATPPLPKMSIEAEHEKYKRMQESAGVVFSLLGAAESSLRR